MVTLAALMRIGASCWTMTRYGEPRHPIELLLVERSAVKQKSAVHL
jgi:hypothetical protein